MSIASEIDSNNKIAVIIGANLRWTPFYYRYERILRENKVDYDLIIWDREQNEYDSNRKMIKFERVDQTNDNNPQKVFLFFEFSRFIKKQIKKNKYSKLLFLGTYAGIPALLSRFLKKNYQNRYWIDIRDITYETFFPFYKMEEQAIKYAKYTVLSSHGFEAHLPKNEYYYIHNIDPSMDEVLSKYHHEFDPDGKIRISYIGNIGFLDEVKRFISLFGNDERFCLGFYGNGSEKVESFCKENGFCNISFHGGFSREETVEFYNKTDIVYNVYGNSSVNLRSAVSNKLYYALRLELPIIVSPSTFMSDISRKYNIGIEYNNESSFPDQLYFWYKNFNVTNASFQKAWEEYFREDKSTIDKLVEFVQA